MRDSIHCNLRQMRGKRDESSHPVRRRHSGHWTQMSRQRLSKAILVFIGLSIVARGQMGLDVARFDKSRIIRAANQYLKEKPVTITASHSPRSAGGSHDFFSEGDYWWPDPKNPDGPYIQRDGMSNPSNFVEHRRALMRMSMQVPA